MLATTPIPPYYAVIFTSLRSADLERKESEQESEFKAIDQAANAYETTAQKMVELAKQQQGFLGLESVRDHTGFGITVSYWDSFENIAKWKRNIEHLQAQARGRKEWYSQLKVRICKVEKDYE